MEITLVILVLGASMKNPCMHVFLELCNFHAYMPYFSACMHNKFKCHRTLKKNSA